MSFYNKDSVFAENPPKIIFESIMGVLFAILLPFIIDYISLSTSKPERKDFNEEICSENSIKVWNAIKKYNKGKNNDNKITEISDNNINLLKNENLLSKGFKKPLMDCKYCLSEEVINDCGVYCEYHDNARREKQRIIENKNKRIKTETSFIFVFIIIWSVFNSILYFVLSLYYKSRERNIYLAIGLVIIFFLVSGISFLVSPVVKSYGFNSNTNEHFIEYRKKHILSLIFPFLVYKKKVSSYDYVNEMLKDNNK